MLISVGMALLPLMDVVAALKSLTVAKTKNLMLHLGVPLNTIEDIECNPQYDADGKKTHFVQRWLEIDGNASWKKIVTELRKLDMIALATTIESEYLRQSEVQVTPCNSASLVPFSAPAIQPVSSTPYTTTPSQQPDASVQHTG